MVRIGTYCLYLAAILQCTAFEISRCDAQELPPAPVPVAADGAPSQAGPVVSPPPQAGRLAPPPALVPPSALAPYEDHNGPLLIGDPLLDRPESPPPGWFAAVESSFLKAHVKNRLASTVAIGAGTDEVTLPNAELDWTGSPRVEIGYRIPQGFGEVLFSYRSLVTEGSSVLPGFDLDGSSALLTSRLNVNVFDLDYSSREYSLAPHWDMKWKAGARLGGVYFDSRALAFFREQRSSNDFRGAGPHVGLDLYRAVPCSPWGFYSRLEAAALIGEVRQSFEEVLAIDDTTVIGGANQQHQTQAVPVVNFEVGATWTPPFDGRWLRLVGGYQFENWWNIGQVGASRAELSAQGVFFRAEFGF